MNSMLKFSIAASMIPLTLIAQSAKVRTVKYEEWSKKFQTYDHSGKYLNAVYVVEVKPREPLDKEIHVPVKFATENTNNQTSTCWYRWDELDRCWVKYKKSTPDKTSNGIVYSGVLDHAGIYALMHPQDLAIREVIFKAPRGYKITQGSLMQNEPGLVIRFNFKKPVSNLNLPARSVAFDTNIEMSLVNRKGEPYMLSKNILGHFVRFSEGTSPSKPLLARIKLKDLKPEQSEGIVLEENP